MKTRLALLLLLFAYCAVFPQQSVERAEFIKFFEQNKVTGCFVLFDPDANRFITVNAPQTDSAFLPASTFKIFNSLVILETGCVNDENEIIPWDSVTRSLPAWNKDQTLRTAFRNSTVWAYQMLARKVGTERMKHWIDKCGYGNQNISGGIDQFWLTGGLRITPKQQTEFLCRLYNNRLPFSQRSMDIVKRIFVYKTGDSLVYSGKTGWGSINDSADVGWWVGSIERNRRVCFFACCLQNYSDKNPNFPACRIEIAEAILKELHILW